MSYTCLQYHLVFSTKQRHPWLHADVMPRLVKFIGGTVRSFGGSLIEAHGPADHIHLAAVLPPTKTVSEMLRDIKANSSRWIHESFGELRTFAWQDGYAAFAVSLSVMPKVVDYIRRQVEHHRKMTFEEEMVRLLTQHGIEFDRRYI